MAEKEASDATLRAALAHKRATLGERHPETLDALTALARYFFKRKRHADAAPLQRELLSAR
jgi:hypothetical protein